MGIDYGTSNSKIVFRDLEARGGEKAYAVELGGTFRIPSAVKVTKNQIVFGQAPMSAGSEAAATWHQSLKMRVAGEVLGKYEGIYHGPQTDLPMGLDARDLAVLTVWYLISLGVQAAVQQLGFEAGGIQPRMTLGIPLSFYENARLKEVFVGIAKQAWRLYREVGVLSEAAIDLPKARELANIAVEREMQQGAFDPNEARQYIRTEAEAALMWPMKSPEVADGPYVQIDIGAGTTNYSSFRIVANHSGGAWIKENIAFFSAFSNMAGMDLVDHQLAKADGIAPGEALTLRGREQLLLQNPKYIFAIQGALKEISSGYREAWDRGYCKVNGPLELRRWDNHRLFFIGGGSLVPSMTERLRDTRLNHLSGGKRKTVLLEKPVDLYGASGERIHSDDYPFLAVAYGLSYDPDEVPKVWTPKETAPMKISSARRREWEIDWRE